MAGVEEILEEFNRLKAACREMEGKKICVGIVGTQNSEVLAIAHAHEYGATIRPKEKKYLAIPLTKEAETAGTPTVFNDLRFVNAKGGNLLMVRDKKKRNGETKSEAMFLLVKSITLPERSFIRASFDEGKDELGKIIDTQVCRVLTGQISAEAAMDKIGVLAAQMVQNFIDEKRVKPESDFSKKQDHTTLHETGNHIRSRITRKVEDK